MYLLGYDLGSSSVKASLVNAESGRCVASAFYPKKEMKISAPQSDWAEQDPELWWSNLILATNDVLQSAEIDPSSVSAIGIAYQMHGLVLVDRDQKLLRSSIIWCDSRAVSLGDRAMQAIGNEQCLSHLLNSPGNFTASKLSWVIENEPEVYEKAYKFMLPGDYIAMKLTGEINTTISGLSEGIMWDFKENSIAGFLLEHYGIHQTPDSGYCPTFSEQGRLSTAAAEELGLVPGIQIAYGRVTSPTMHSP